SLNMWNGDNGCDGREECGYHHVRFHLADQRGLVEDSIEWSHRINGLLDLNQLAQDAGHRWVTSSNEGRLSELGCDLLDRDSDVSHAQGRVAGQSYLSDYAFWVGEILDGRVDLSQVRIETYAAEPAAEDAR